MFQFFWTLPYRPVVTSSHLLFTKMWKKFPFRIWKNRERHGRKRKDGGKATSFIDTTGKVAFQVWKRALPKPHYGQQFKQKQQLQGEARCKAGCRLTCDRHMWYGVCHADFPLNPVLALNFGAVNRAPLSHWSTNINNNKTSGGNGKHRYRTATTLALLAVLSSENS